MGMTIDQVCVALQPKNGVVTISDKTLDSPTISNLLTTYFSGQAIVIHNAEQSPGDGADNVVIKGTSTFLNVDMNLTATFSRASNGDVTALFQYQPQPSWTFSQSFRDLPTSVDFSQDPATPLSPFLDRLLQTQALTNVLFVVSSDRPREAAQGYTFTATLSPRNVPGSWRRSSARRISIWRGW